MTRMNYFHAAPAVARALLAMDEAGKELTIPLGLSELIKMRVSQINGCAYCMDMHAPRARAAGVSQQKLDVLAGWRESPAFDAQERAALGWAEALARVETTGAPDADYDALAAVFSEQERAEITYITTLIGTWNRFTIGFRGVHAIRSADP